MLKLIEYIGSAVIAVLSNSWVGPSPRTEVSVFDYQYVLTIVYTKNDKISKTKIQNQSKWLWMESNAISSVSGYYYYTPSFNEAWTQVFSRFKPWLQHVRDSWWWVSLIMVPAGNKAQRLSLVNHTTKAIQFIRINVLGCK